MPFNELQAHRKTNTPKKQGCIKKSLLQSVLAIMQKWKLHYKTNCQMGCYDFPRTN